MELLKLFTNFIQWYERDILDLSQMEGQIKIYNEEQTIVLHES